MQSDISTRKALARAEATTRRNAAFLADQSGTDADTAAVCFNQLLSMRFGADLAGIALAGYMPMRSELSPLAIMTHHPGPVCVPVIAGAGLPLEFHRWTRETRMTEGPFKALIPAQRDPVTPKALIVPLLAFDRNGYRLGYGGGFYDRTLEKLRNAGSVLAIGLAFDAQICDALPVEDTDQQLDAVVTGSGVVWSRLD
ncbi:5-formyltetrahydrofolate cyclo-ligase [Roseinatronobacter sp. S2]|uniref:5-formyltetrahydrofolate cyclo-ligase n=1 Tax=Roseinatronobacter sp. S2 TaxID=3035471 RepID=UPI0024101478|nr:5-formyltetrahydrofolate cyclo-ligase [Roseinatronobacter sp. S2]WFE76346.1 5-formyltetrahydrofolate cyclo-ligase [Roseinatronobacter sp. S2]